MLNRDRVSKIVLLLLVLSISAIFFSMIRPFLMAIFLAGIFSAMAQPIYRYLRKCFRGRKGLASLATLLFITFVLLLPLVGLLGIITAQAVKVGQSVKPWVQEQLSEPAAFSEYFKNLPFYEELLPYREELLRKLGELASSLSSFLINSLSSVTLLTANFIFMLFVFLYTTFFFLMEGDKLLNRILYYLPLEDKDERRLLDKFTSVTRATLKGTAVIGILQGGLSGLAFAIVGIDSAIFWGTMMTILSIIPGIGAGLIWGPAALILLAEGHIANAIGLTVFCMTIVGSIDNLLRPRLLGKDTEMHDLLIFFGTLGGLALFGVLGFIIGPIISALFVTVWEIYGDVFRSILPSVGEPILPLSKPSPPPPPKPKPPQSEDASGDKTTDP